jgi:hypothetical protein
MRALLAHVAQEYAQKTAEVLAQFRYADRAFHGVDRYLLHDCWIRARATFVQLWACRIEDASSGELLQDFYATDITEIRRLLEELSRTSDNRLLGQRATIIAGVIEGMMLMVGQRSARCGRAARAAHGDSQA